jgi:hypothetical protein
LRIENSVFSGCSSLSSICVPSGLRQLDRSTGVFESPSDFY